MTNQTYVNPIAEGADAHVVRDGGRYLWCQSEGNRGVAVWESDRLTSMGRKHVVWRAPQDGPASRAVWAPELHRLDGRWHIYCAASDGTRSHRAYVLVADTDDPCGPYTLHGPLDTGEVAGNPVWAIDMTVLEVAGARYAVWSGWESAETDVQHLYIAAMPSPTELMTPRRLLCRNDTYPWEYVTGVDVPRYLNEGPQAVHHDGRTFLLFAANGSWVTTYATGVLELVGDDPLAADAWHKHSDPVCVATSQVPGPGHACVVDDPEGGSWFVQHAKVDADPGWRRAVHVEPLRWRGGRPYVGEPASPGTRLPSPPGTPSLPVTGENRWSFRDDPWPAGMSFHGHHQLIDTDGGLRLGRVPEVPVNLYRAGEKLTVDDGDWADVTVTAAFTIVEGARAVGLLARASDVAVGHHAQRGYIAGVAPGRGRLVVGRSDGDAWTELAAVPCPITHGDRASVTFTLNGDELVVEARRGVSLETVPVARVQVHDSAYSHGTVGVRVNNAEALFEDLRVTPLPSV